MSYSHQATRKEKCYFAQNRGRQVDFCSYTLLLQVQMMFVSLRIAYSRVSGAAIEILRRILSPSCKSERSSLFLMEETR